MWPLEKFDHWHFARLWQNGRKKEAEKYRLSFQAKQTAEEETQDDLATLRAKYTEVTGKNVSPRYMNDAERLKANTL